MNDAEFEAVAGPWPGPYSGLPPLDRLSPAEVEAAVMRAIEQKRRAVAAVATSPEPPTFRNTVEALEEIGRPLRNAESVRLLMSTTASIGDMPEVSRRIAPLVAQLEDEIALDGRLFARIEAVLAAAGALEPVEARLTAVIHDRMKRLGAGLTAERRARLIEVNQRIAALQSRFQQNELKESERLLWVEDASALEGLPQAAVTAAAKLAETHGQPGRWAFANIRAVVWTILQHGRDRGLRKRIRDMWAQRNACGDAIDNRELTAEIVTLRGEKARLLGFESFAQLATDARMARTPERALEQLWSIWHPVKRDALAQIDALQALADSDGLGARIQAHDLLYYGERRREQRFNFDAGQVREYLSLENVVSALFDAAGRLHGLSFRPIDDVPVLHADVRVYEVSRGGQILGLLYQDLIARPGKMPSAWQQELRQAETFQGHYPPLSVMCANIERPADGSPALMPWEIANVLFHEFGHSLHMLLSRSPYPSLGSVHLAWDAIELPSQLNERWLFDRELLRRNMRHHRTGEPMPDRLIDALIAVRADERVVSVTLPYLAPAIVDMEIFLAARGGPVDPLAIEREVYERLQMPEAIDPIMRLPHQHHSFTDSYAAGLYSYLWADVLVAEVLEAFGEAPGKIYDRAVAERFRDTLLGAANLRPVEQAFRDFRGRDPDPQALVRRFRLEETQ